MCSYAAFKIWQHDLDYTCRQQSAEFHQVLQACSVPTQHHVYDDRSHAGFVIDWTGPPLDSQVQTNPFPYITHRKQSDLCGWSISPFSAA